MLIKYLILFSVLVIVLACMIFDLCFKTYPMVGCTKNKFAFFPKKMGDWRFIWMVNYQETLTECLYNGWFGVQYLTWVREYNGNSYTFKTKIIEQDGL